MEARIKDNQKLTESSPGEILIVEDYVDLSKMIAFKLRQDGYKSKVVHSGFDALENLNNKDYLLMILDYNLPDMTGLEIVEKMNEYNRQIPFIAVTAHGNLAVAVKMMKEGARDYIVKEEGFVDMLPTVVNKVINEIYTETELKGYQEELRDSQNMLSRAQRIAKMGSWDWNIETGDIIWSDEMYRIYNYPSDREPQDYSKFVHPDEISTVENIFTEAINEHSTLSTDYRILCYDKTEKHIHVEGEILRNKSGAPIQLRGTAMDITDRISVEEQLRQAQKQEVIGQMIGGIAHDFNNILMAISGAADLLLLELPDGDKTLKYVHTILKRSQKAAGLVKQMLAYNRIQKLNKIQLDINQIVSDIAELLDRGISENIDFKLELVSDPLPVFADKIAIEQIIMNVCLNACDAMPDGGKLIVETTITKADDNSELQDRETDFASIKVIDTGTGMDKKTRERIFEPFFTTKEVGKGTGLGLSMTDGLVKLHDGDISVTSQKGEGTEFTILIPLDKTDQASDKETGDQTQTDKIHETIMVVEDEPEVLKILTNVLNSYGYKVLSALNGKEAIDLFRRTDEKIDLIITDIVMPEIGGQKVFEEISALDSKVKFLFMSGYSAVQEKRANENMQILEKPFRIQEVNEKIRKILDG